MNLQLPPERTLDHPDQMLDRILTEPPATRRPVSRIGWVVGLAAALAVITTAIGLHQRVDATGDVATGPVISASPFSPSASGHPTFPLPAPTQAPKHQPRPVLTPHGAVGEKYTFPHLTVTLRNAGQLSANGTAVDEYTLLVTTCVTSAPRGAANQRVRLREADWTVTTTSGVVTIDDPIRTPLPLPVTYPGTGDYRVGRCVSGTIPFGVDHRSTVTAVNYHNSLGDQASWFPRR